MSQFTFELAIPPGINSDATAFASEGLWASGSNVRFFEGLPQAAGQDQAAHITSLFNVYGIFKRTSSLIAFSDQNGLNLAVYSGGSISVVTPTGWPANARPTFAAWGTTMLVNPTGGKLYSQVGTSVATAVAAAPTTITTILVTPERQVLALGCNEEASTTFNGLCIRGCDLEDYTNWTTSPTNNAFEHILEGTGSIVGARMIGSYVAVLTGTSLYMGQFIGDPGQTYRFDKIEEACGCIAMNAMTVADGALYWMGVDSRLRCWTPGARPQVIPCTVFNDFMAGANSFNTGQAALSFMTYLSRWGEIRFDYPNTSIVSNYISYAIRESTMAQRPVWTQGTTYRTAALDEPTFPYTLAAIASGSGNGIAYVDSPIAGDNWSIRTGDRYLNSAKTRVQIQRFVPDFTASGSTTIGLYLRDRPQSSTVVHKTYTCTYSAKKVDFRASGMIVSVEFSGNNAPWRLGKPVFECVTQGGR